MLATLLQLLGLMTALEKYINTKRIGSGIFALPTEEVIALLFLFFSVSTHFYILFGFFDRAKEKSWHS